MSFTDSIPAVDVKKAKLSDEGKATLKRSLGIWAIGSIIYLWTIWLFYVNVVYEMTVDFTKSYTAVTITVFAIITITYIVEALIDTAQKEWWEEVEEEQSP